MKTKVCAILLAVLVCFSSVASALTAEQREKFKALEVMLEIVVKDIDLGTSLEPTIVFEEDPARMTVHVAMTDMDTRMMKLIFDSSTEEAKQPVVDMYTSFYNLVYEATKNVDEDLPIVVTLGGNDGGVAIYTINGVDMSEYIIEE